MFKNTVHFIVPSYKGSKTVKLCLNSILKQNYPQELIKISVVENGPKDGVEAIVNSFSNCSYHYNSIQGRSEARNYLLDEIFSEFIAFIDVDVQLDENWLKECLIASNTPFCATVTGPVYKKGERWLDKFRKNISNLTTHGASNSLENPEVLGSINTAAVLFKTLIIKKMNGFNTSLKRSEDYELTHRLLRTGYILVTTQRAEAFVSWDRGFFEYFFTRYFQMGLYVSKIHQIHQIPLRGENFKKTKHKKELSVFIGQILVNTSFSLGKFFGRMKFKSTKEWTPSLIIKKVIIEDHGRLVLFKFNPKYEILIIRGEPRLYKREIQKFIKLPEHIKEFILEILFKASYQIKTENHKLILDEVVRNELLLEAKGLPQKR